MTARAGFIYVVERANGTVKVGRSGTRFNRLAAYCDQTTELLVWSSPRHSGYVGSERHLINALVTSGLLASGAETFRVGFFDAVSLARAVVSEVTECEVAA